MEWIAVAIVLSVPLYIIIAILDGIEHRLSEISEKVGPTP